MKEFVTRTLPIVFIMALFDAVCLFVAIMTNKSETSLAIAAIMIMTNVVVIAMVK
jgi:hypothetical protein